MEKAVELYTLSANQGNAKAQFNLAICYEKSGLRKNIEKAITYPLVLSDSTLLPLSVKYDDFCTICLDSIGGEVVILKCLHRFHKECIDDWKKSSSLTRSHYTCPICRQVHYIY